MAKSSLADRRPRPAAAEPLPAADTATSSPLAQIVSRSKAMLAEGSDDRIAQLVAGKVLLIRVGSAFIALVSQVLLARWMGSFEFGIFVYAWTWVLMIGALSDMGLSSASRRFIPEYTELKQGDLLRGFLSGARWLAFAIATTIGLAGIAAVTLAAPYLSDYETIPLYFACATIPIYGLVQVQAGIAQSYDWPNLALIPFYIFRQVVLTALIGAAYVIGAPTHAVTAILVALGSTWAVTLAQGFVLDRRLKAKIETGRKCYDPTVWLKTALPIFVVEGFYLLLTYVDILALEHLSTPDQVAIYYAAARLLAIVAFVYFAVAGATTHRFTEYHMAGDSERLASFFRDTVHWTFWPSLAVCAAILALGVPLLELFGAGFARGYDVMFILAVGMLARAGVGPAERLLNMLGERKPCALTYAGAFVVNLTLCVILIPRSGIEGAAFATSTAIVCESVALYTLARRKLGVQFFIAGGAKAAG